MAICPILIFKLLRFPFLGYCIVVHQCVNYVSLHGGGVCAKVTLFLLLRVLSLSCVGEIFKHWLTFKATFLVRWAILSIRIVMCLPSFFLVTWCFNCWKLYSLSLVGYGLWRYLSGLQCAVVQSSDKAPQCKHFQFCFQFRFHFRLHFLLFYKTLWQRPLEHGQEQWMHWKSSQKPGCR